MNSYEIIKKPLITEKSMKLVEAGKYSFSVDLKATKEDVRKAIEEIFNVHVTKVNMSNSLPKDKRMGRYVGKVSAVQKAVVTLAKGEKIEIFAK